MRQPRSRHTGPEIVAEEQLLSLSGPATKEQVIALQERLRLYASTFTGINTRVEALEKENETKKMTLFQLSCSNKQLARRTETLQKDVVLLETEKQLLINTLATQKAEMDFIRQQLALVFNQDYSDISIE